MVYAPSSQDILHSQFFIPVTTTGGVNTPFKMWENEENEPLSSPAERRSDGRREIL